MQQPPTISTIQVEDERLVPTEVVLEFNLFYVRACAETPAEMDSIGLYSAGWQL